MRRQFDALFGDSNRLSDDLPHGPEQQTSEQSTDLQIYPSGDLRNSDTAPYNGDTAPYEGNTQTYIEHITLHRTRTRM